MIPFCIYPWKAKNIYVSHFPQSNSSGPIPLDHHHQTPGKIVQIFINPTNFLHIETFKSPEIHKIQNL